MSQGQTQATHGIFGRNTHRLQHMARLLRPTCAGAATAGSNPRQIKRFDNAFRLQLYVANQDRDCELDFTLDELVALGRWVALRLRWPELAKALDDEPALLGVLEANANEIAPQADLDEIARLQKRYKRWFEDREILEFLNDVHLGEARRVSTLEPGSFLHVA